MTKKNDVSLDGFAQDISKSLVKSWKKREDIKIPIINKTFKNYGKIPTIIQEVIDNHWKKEELKPLIVEKNREENKYAFIIHLPPGIVSYKDFKSKENYFNDAVNGQVHIERRGKTVILTVLEGELETNILYKFDPTKYPNMFLPFPVGYSVNGLEVRDFAKFPYMLDGGLPDFGKSNLIHNINVALLTGRSDTCFIITIDFKMSEYATYMNEYGLLVTNEEDAYNALLKLELELEKRMKMCAKLGKQKIHNMHPNIRPPFIVIELDEITELQHKDSQLSLNRILRLGRAYGFCVIIATQKPSARTFRNATFTETRSLCAARMCFHVMENDDSIMVLGNSKGVDIPTVQGRGIFKHGRDEVEVQTMYVDPEKIPHMLKNYPRAKKYDMNNDLNKDCVEVEYECREDYDDLKQKFQGIKKLPKMLPPRQ